VISENFLLHVLSGAALVLYIISCAAFGRAKGPAGSILAGAGTFIHAWVSVSTRDQSGLGFWLSLATLATALVFLLYGRKRFRGLASAIMLLVVILYALSAILAHLEDPAQRLENWTLLLIAHIATTLAGVICFLFASFAATALLWQDRSLKRKRVEGIVDHLPPIRVLATLSRQFLSAGIWSMTIGLCFGFLYAIDLELKIPVWDPKLLWSMVVLLYYGVLLTARAGGRLSELRFARLCSLGSILVFLSLFAAIRPASSFHPY